MAKHKRVLHDKTPTGLPRWLRAADNAVRNPNSPGARLYYRRVANAQRLREKYGNGSPVVFFDYRIANWDTTRDIVADTTKRKYLVCSTFCAALHVQKMYMIEFRSEQEGTYRSRHWRTGEMNEYPKYVRHEVAVTMDQLEDFFENDTRANLLALSGITLKRSVKCAVCWTDIKP